MTATSIDLLRDYSRGEALKAADVNALIGTARRQMHMTGDDFVGDQDVFATGGHGRKQGERSNRGDWFKNNIATSAPPGAVMVPTEAFSIVDLTGWKSKQRDAGGLEPCLVNDLFATIVQNGQGHCRFAWKGAWCLYDNTDGAPTFGQLWGANVSQWNLSRGGSMDFMALGNSFQIGTDYYGNFVQLVGTEVFAVTNGSLSHGGTVTVETLKYTGGSPKWARTGFTLSAEDIFMNTGETADAGTIVGIKYYDTKTVIAAMYCNANDWL